MTEKHIDGCPSCGGGNKFTLQFTSIEYNEYTKKWRWGWTIDTYNNDVFTGVAEVSYCPYCGEKLPTGLLLETLNG